MWVAPGPPSLAWSTGRGDKPCHRGKPGILMNRRQERMPVPPGALPSRLRKSHMPNTSRRTFLQSVGLTAAAMTAAGTGLPRVGLAADANASAPREAPKFRLGIVTYNIAAQWDLPTILKVLKSVGIGPVEFRTGHKHGVEPSLSKDQRKTVRKQCEDAGVEVWGCGTTCEFQSPDPAAVQKNIEECKRFI